MAIQGTPELRKKLKRFYREYWQVAGQAETPPFPEECRGMTCGAKTRKGTPCQQTALYGGNGRCKFHGGMSTGPKTKKGKKRSARNGLLPKHKPLRQTGRRSEPHEPIANPGKSTA